ncbi:hypothetical protein UlMin_038105 [Ulmus minor]
MADQKVTIMVLKVDLQCCRCYKKIKKVLCKFPQIRDQVYDEKTNTIVIKVVCCSPEKIKQKIICKAGDTLKSIEIKKQEKLNKDSKDDKGSPKQEKLNEDSKDSKPCSPKQGSATCCSDCYHGNPGGPCYRGYGWPPPLCYHYYGYCGRPVYDSYGGGTYCTCTNEYHGACSIM